MEKKKTALRRLAVKKLKSRGKLTKNKEGAWERTRLRQEGSLAVHEFFHRTLRYVSDDQDSLAIYYQLLGKCASQYKAPRWFVETVILYTFLNIGGPGSIEKVWPHYHWNPLIVDLDKILLVRQKEIDKAVKRWSNKVEEYLDYLMLKQETLDI